MFRPPWSATVTGLMAAEGVTIPTLISAPGLPPADPGLLVEPGVSDVPNDLPPKISVRLLLLHAARIGPSSGAEMPTTLARRMKSRRESRPAANSSMTWLATSPWTWRMRPSRLPPVGLVMGAPGIPPIRRIGIPQSAARELIASRAS